MSSPGRTVFSVEVLATRFGRAIGVMANHSATVMVANGVSLRAVQVIGGWSSLRMVERYAHVDDAELQRAVRITHTHADAATNAPTKTPTGEKTAQTTPKGLNSGNS